MAQTVYEAVRREIPSLGPWKSFDALEVQRIADALKIFFDDDLNLISKDTNMTHEHELVSRLQSLLDRMSNDARTALMFEADGDTLRDVMAFIRERQHIAKSQNSEFEIYPPNDAGSTNCIVRWMVDTPDGWIGAWSKEALEGFISTRSKQSRKESDEPSEALLIIRCISMIEAELLMAEMNDTRLPPVFEQQIGELAVRSSALNAVIDYIKERHEKA